MKPIANIVSENELTNHKKVDWINYVKSVEECETQLTLPTLIVGWKNYKKNFPHLHPDILHKEMNRSYPRVAWEFTMDEKITEHFTGIENFVKQAPRYYIDLFKYQPLDPIADNITTIEDLLSRIPNVNGEGSSYYQYKDEIIYVFDRYKCVIYGVYLNAFKYFGFDTKEILTQFNNKFSVKTIDQDGSIYQSFYRQFPDFDRLKRSMVLFLM